MARIIYFSRDYSSHDWRFLDVLANSEHQVFFLRLERGEQIYEDRPLPAGIELIVWKGGQKPVRQYEYLELIDDLKRVIRLVNPDLIHAGPIQSTALLVALSGFCPLISMSWGYDLLLDAEQDPFSEWATRYTLQRSKLMIADCNTIRLRAIPFGIPDERIVTFPWGVDLHHFKPGEKKEAKRNLTFLSTRSWEPIYGVDLVANAFVKAASENPNLNLVMLGAGSMKKTLHKIFLEGGVSERVDFAGQVSYNQLPDYYRQADIYLSASHIDGASISLLEAMACGCPVLVSDIPGNREWVQSGVNGWVFPIGNENSLAKAMLDIANKSGILLNMGLAARAVAEERADWKVNSQSLLAAYHKVLNEVIN
jgi:L-malate glycosyltransferase